MNSYIRNIKQVFIVGCARSGTTYLQSFLAAHPDIQSFYEAHFFCRIGSALTRKDNIKELKKAANILFADKPNYQKVFGKRFFSVNGVVRTFIKCLNRITEEEGKKIWMDKTPMNLYYIDTIKGYLPESRFIHIIRNGKDVVASLYEVSRKFPEFWGGARSVETCVKRWNRDLLLSKAFDGKKDHFILIYEDLLRNPEFMLGKLVDFLEIKFSPEMIGKRVKNASKIIRDFEYWKGDVLKENFGKRTNKFESLFSDEEKIYIERNLVNSGEYLDENKNS